MNNYVTGHTIRTLREATGLTQAELGNRLGVTDKAISKWETGKGLPDISLLQPLARTLGVSLIELMNGERIVNRNVSANLLRCKLYICPVCGNVVHSLGNAVISCCGITLPPADAESPDEHHTITVEEVEDEHFVTLRHPMTKDHFISFMAFVTTDRMQMVRLYPESPPETRLQLWGRGDLYFCCKRHGLFRLKL